MDKDVWKCPNCGWEERAHPNYGWAKFNAHAVEVHRMSLCPSLNGA
jgi:hypothetical protein